LLLNSVCIVGVRFVATERNAFGWYLPYRTTQTIVWR